MAPSPAGRAVSERWFFALWPAVGTARALATAGRGLIPPGARAAHPLDLHLTLRFLGDLSAERLAAAEQAGDTVSGRPFALRIDQAGSFPRARVLWCAPSLVPAGLLDLSAALEQALAAGGFAPEPRPFCPHLTLARKFRGPAVLPWGLSVDWEVHAFVLARGRDGLVPRYAAARRWPLTAGFRPERSRPEPPGTP